MKPRLGGCWKSRYGFVDAFFIPIPTHWLTTLSQVSPKLVLDILRKRLCDRAWVLVYGW
ncbi:hypothetical protein [Coleofasciculus sp.]|uniref:hypothetical protein n=1 Tax=Coleofasciculus sp. TaxID=3100458 RepID=UPI0040639440